MRLDEIEWLDSLKSEISPGAVEQQPFYSRKGERQRTNYHPISSRKGKSAVVTPAKRTVEDLEDIIRRFQNVKSFTEDERRQVMKMVRQIISKLQSTTN